VLVVYYGYDLAWVSYTRLMNFLTVFIVLVYFLTLSQNAVLLEQWHRASAIIFSQFTRV